MAAARRSGLLRAVGPGLLIAATGVGAGDLATGALSGSRLGLAVLWAVLIGAFLKFVLTEGLARWQIATGTTLLEGAFRHLGRPARIGFLIYLVPWSYFVGSALISACGVTAQAMIPTGMADQTGKIVFGIAASLLGVVLVRAGGYRLFEKVMTVTVGLMFLTVLATAVLLRPDAAGVLSGIFIPSLPVAGGDGIVWTVALMGGVGGTLTILCYGYWIREEGRDCEGDLGLARIDLGVGYAATMVFGMAMVIIGSRVTTDGRGAGLIVGLADQLTDPLGVAGRWVFLVGAFAAVFSSLLGVWQAVPYLFADFVRLGRARDGGGNAKTDLTRTKAYRLWLYGIATIPLLGLFSKFEHVQKVYAVVGALFIPILAAVLLNMNGKKDWVGARFRNRWPSTLALLLAVAVFLLFGFFEVKRRLD